MPASRGLRRQRFAYRTVPSLPRLLYRPAIWHVRLAALNAACGLGQL